MISSKLTIFNLSYWYPQDLTIASFFAFRPPFCSQLRNMRVQDAVGFHPRSTLSEPRREYKQILECQKFIVLFTYTGRLGSIRISKNADPFCRNVFKGLMNLFIVTPRYQREYELLEVRLFFIFFHLFKLYFTAVEYVLSPQFTLSLKKSWSLPDVAEQHLWPYWLKLIAFGIH